MSVSFANAVAAGLRAHGVTVHYIAGWDRRGNGQTSNYQGMIWHHTATGFGFAPSILWNGRSDLSGPLCNTAGNADGSVTIVAAHPANHAGASGGRSMGPLPRTNSFNKYVWGHEIVYPGTVPMTAAQYRSALILAGVVGGILKRPSPEWIRQHFETSVTGKWDPGYANGKTYSGAQMRADIWGALMGAAPPIPAPAPVPVVPKKRLKPVIIHEKLSQGENYLRIPAMVGSASGAYGTAWVSISGEGGGDMTVAFQKDAPNDGPPPGAGDVWGPTVFRNASRVRKQLPDGTEYLEVWVTLRGRTGFVSVEFLNPKQ